MEKQKCLLKKSFVTNSLHFFFVWALGFKRKIYLGMYLKNFAHSCTVTGQKTAQVVLAITWLLKQHNAFCHILSNDVLAFALSGEIFWKKWRLCSASVFPWEKFGEQGHNPMSILLINGWQNGKCHFISEMSYFFLLLLVIPAYRHKGCRDDSFKLMCRVRTLLLSDKLILVYFGNLRSSIFYHTGWPWLVGPSVTLVGPERFLNQEAKWLL